jgi:hypothetical protein
VIGLPKANDMDMEQRIKQLKESGALVLSNSRIKKRRTCDFAYYCRYVEKLRKKAKGSALVRGSAIHECIEYYNTGRSWKKAQRDFKNEWEETYLLEEKEEMGDIPKMVYDLMEGYVEYYSDEEIEYLESEKEFLLKLMTYKGIDVYLTGFIDFIAKDPKGNIWIGETKTHKRFPDESVRLFNMQSSIYIWALNQMGYKKVKGVIWNYIRAKQPSTPQILKSGRISKSKCDSIPTVVERFLKEQGENLGDWADFINGLSWDNFYRRYEERVSMEVVNSVMEDVIETAKDIIDNPERKAKNLNGMSCQWCDYNDICQAHLIGADVGFIIKSKYEKGDKK